MSHDMMSNSNTMYPKFFQAASKKNEARVGQNLQTQSVKAIFPRRLNHYD